MTKLEKLSKMKKDYETACAEVGKEGISEFLTDFFKKNSEVNALRWNQYTPYFNDGDACVFSLHGLTFSTIDIHSVKIEHPEWHDQGFHDPYNLAESEKNLKKSLDKVEETLEDMLDVLETAFGDHVQVTVYRKGNVEVEEYEHD